MAKSKTSQKVMIGVLAIVTAISLGGLTGLFGGGSTVSPHDGNTAGDEINSQQAVAISGVPCLTSEEFHLHPHLAIMVDGENFPVPGNIGVFPDCIQELHTHEADGTIHVESDTDKGYTFADFLNVIGLTLEQPGFVLNLTVDGESNDNNPNFVLEDGQEILLEYTSIPDLGGEVNKSQNATPET